MSMPSCHRRQVVALAALFTASALGRARADDAFPAGAELIVAGPADGVLARWGDALGGSLQRAMPEGATLRLVAAGGADGVTAANQFDAWAEPDGSMLLLAPGTAALAALTGDPRAHFDAGRWVTLIAAQAPGVLCARAGAGGTLRVAAAGPAGPDLPGLLGLDLLGMPAVPVFGLTDADATLAALAQGAADAVLLHGRAVPERAAMLAARGFAPVFTLGPMDAAGHVARDPAFPDVPHLAELYQRRSGGAPAGDLAAAWRAAATCVQLDAALVLPPLTPATIVAQWRHIGAASVADAGVQSDCQAAAVRPLLPEAASSATAMLALDAAPLLALRRWLQERYNWRPA